MWFYNAGATVVAIPDGNRTVAVRPKSYVEIVGDSAELGRALSSGALLRSAPPPGAQSIAPEADAIVAKPVPVMVPETQFAASVEEIGVAAAGRVVSKRKAAE